MKTRIFLLLSLLLSGLVILSACAPEISSEEPQEPPAPEEVPYPNPVVEEPQELSVPYPYPAPELAVQPGEPYPAPQEGVADDTFSTDPYPGVEVVGNASDRDLSNAIRPADFSVQPGDENLQTGRVFIDHHEIIMKESYPVEVVLVVAGNLPTPCHQLRVVHAEPDETGYIEVNAYSVVDPDQMCTQVLEPFAAVVPLGEYTDGAFTFSINKELNGKFKLP